MDIKEIREITGLSQSKFAKRFNIPVRTLQEWEQGKRQPPEYVLELLEFKVRKDTEETSMRKQIMEWGLKKNFKGFSDTEIYNMICDNFYITDFEEARKCSFELFERFNK